MRAPSPRGRPVVGHLGRWGLDPLGLLDEGARLGPVFGLRLWRRALVGWSPTWNRRVLGDLAVFRSAGSMSGLTPYLNAGVVQLDAPAHRERRRELNPSFSHRAVTPLAEQVRGVVDGLLPAGEFDAGPWTSALMREVITAVFLDGRSDPRLLARFLRPLDRALPAPFVRRPLLFRRLDRVLADRLAAAPDGSLAAVFRELPDGVAELRTAISAAYDTTAHTAAWLLAHVARDPGLLDPAVRPHVVDEVLRLYPAGWIGSRRSAADVEIEGVPVPAGALVLYSPYLTQRDPELWPDPLAFRPERFLQPVPAWGYLPFGAGERTCLGRHLARLILDAVLDAAADRPLRFVSGDLTPRAGLTLAPTGPLLLRARPCPGPSTRAA